jgi:SAM-dependent methyltransferase
MTPLVCEFVKRCSESLNIQEPIIEFGSLRVSGQEIYPDLRTYFSGKEYIGADMRAGNMVDKVINLHNTGLPDNSVGCAICCETFEHVEYPQQAIDEIYKILKSNGILIITVPFRVPIHAHPDDYWRFTPSALKSLMKRFYYVWTDSFGKEEFPHCVVAIGFKGKIKGIDVTDLKKKYYYSGFPIYKYIRMCIEAYCPRFIKNIKRRIFK